MYDNKNMKEQLDTDSIWKLIELYFKDKHLERCIRHQVESYNDFINNRITDTIEMFNPVVIHSEQDYDTVNKKYNLELILSFKNFHIYRPQIHENNGATKIMYPQEARLRNFTYASAMTIDIDIKIIHRTGDKLQNSETLYKNLEKVHIGKIPIMLGLQYVF